MRLFLQIATIIVISIANPVALLIDWLGPSHDEVARVTSRDGSLDAVLVESNGGAMTSYWYDVYVVPKGHAFWSSPSAAYLYGATRNVGAFGVDLAWKAPSLLAIRFFHARRAIVEVPEASVNNRKISVTLESGVFDRNAPGGGMLYNLHHRQ